MYSKPLEGPDTEWWAIYCSTSSHWFLHPHCDHVTFLDLQDNNIILVRWFIIGGETERACTADLMFCNGTQTTDDSRICHCSLFHQHGKQNFVQPFLRSRKLLYSYTHAWTKIHNEVMSWISGAYECHYAWSLPEANSTTVHDLTASPVSSLPLSLMVCSHNHRHGVR